MTYVDPQGPPPERVVHVRREGGATGWFVAGAVAIVAVVAIAFMLTVGARTPSQDQLAQGAQTGAAQATIVAQQAARDASAAADSARRSTETTAANAAQAARDASANAALSRDDTLAPSADPNIRTPPAQTQPQPQPVN
jgi:hypothetical protein